VGTRYIYFGNTLQELKWSSVCRTFHHFIEVAPYTLEGEQKLEDEQEALIYNEEQPERDRLAELRKEQDLTESDQDDNHVESGNEEGGTDGGVHADKDISRGFTEGCGDSGLVSGIHLLKVIYIPSSL